MSDKPVNPLRLRMIEDMSVRNFNENICHPRRWRGASNLHWGDFGSA
jgi:hypothetical protein